MWELVTGAKAYAGLSHEEVIQAVVLRGCRPQLPPQAAPERALPKPLAELAAECWSSDPQLRPSFKDVLYRIDFLAMPVAAVMVGGAAYGGGSAVVFDIDKATPSIPARVHRNKAWLMLLSLLLPAVLSYIRQAAPAAEGCPLLLSSIQFIPRRRCQ